MKVNLPEEVSCPQCDGRGYEEGNGDDYGTTQCAMCGGLKCVYLRELYLVDEYRNMFFDIVDNAMYQVHLARQASIYHTSVARIRLQ